MKQKTKEISGFFKSIISKITLRRKLRFLMIYTLLSKAYSISFPIIGETTVKLLKNSMRLLGMFCVIDLEIELSKMHKIIISFLFKFIASM